MSVSFFDLNISVFSGGNQFIEERSQAESERRLERRKPGYTPGRNTRWKVNTRDEEIFWVEGGGIFRYQDI